MPKALKNKIVIPPSRRDPGWGLPIRLTDEEMTAAWISARRREDRIQQKQGGIPNEDNGRLMWHYQQFKGLMAAARMLMLSPLEVLREARRSLYGCRFTFKKLTFDICTGKMRGSPLGISAWNEKFAEWIDADIYLLVWPFDSHQHTGSLRLDSLSVVGWLGKNGVRKFGKFDDRSVKKRWIVPAERMNQPPMPDIECRMDLIK